MRVSSVRTRTRWRYAVFRTSAGSFGSILESYVPSTSTMRSMPSSVVLSPPRISPSFPDDLLHEKFAGSVRRADERSGGDVDEAHRLARLAESVEGLRRNVLLHREMPIARSQILAQGQDVHVRGAKVPHRLEDLLARLPQAEHDRGLREESVAHALRSPEDVKALRVVGAAVPHDGLEAFDRLDIVVKHVHAGVDDGPHRLEVSLEIRDEGLDEQVGTAGLDLPHRGSDPEPLRFPLREHDSHLIVDSAYEPEPSRASRQPNRNSTP